MLRAFGDDLENLGVQRDDFGRHMSCALVDLPRYFDKQRRRHDVGQDREVGLVIGGLQSAKLQLRLLQEGLGIESRRQRSYRRRGATIECRLDTRCARCGREFRHRDATGGGRLGHRTRHEKSAHQHDRADHEQSDEQQAAERFGKPEVRHQRGKPESRCNAGDRTEPARHARWRRRRRRGGSRSRSSRWRRHHRIGRRAGSWRGAWRRLTGRNVLALHA